MADLRDEDADRRAESDEHESTYTRRSARQLHPRHMVVFVVRVFAYVVVILCLIASVGYLAIEGGFLDKPLTAKSGEILNQLAGKKRNVAVGATRLRISSHGDLVLLARDIEVSGTQKQRIVDAGEARISVDLWQLLRGKLKINNVELDGIKTDISNLADGGNGDVLSTLRVDAVPIWMDALFHRLVELSDFLGAPGGTSISVRSLAFDVPAMQRKRAYFNIDRLTLNKADDGTLILDGEVWVNDQPASIEVRARRNGKAISQVELQITDFNVTPFASKTTREGAPHLGLVGSINVAMKLQAAGENRKPEAALELEVGDASFYGSGDAVAALPSRLEAHYDFEQNKIEIDPGIVRFEGLEMPFSGGLIDGDRLAKPGLGGIAIDLIVDGGVASPKNSGGRPLDFAAKAFATYDPAGRVLKTEDALISTAEGVLGVSATFDFGAERPADAVGYSPQISLGLFTQNAQTQALKQLWPFWLAGPARNWAYGNVFGGVITNGSLALYLPAGRLPLFPEPVSLNEKELQLGFDIERARVNIAGDIPPLRDTKGHLELTGGNLDVTIEEGNAYFPSGRVVALRGGTFRIADLAERPLTAETEMAIAGPADAVAELATYRPISALEATGYNVDEFTGEVTADLWARFALRLEAEKENKPEWRASLKLSKVSLTRAIGGKTVSAIDGTLEINPSSASLDASLALDGVPMQIKMVEPLEKGAPVKRQRTVSATLTQNGMARLVPGLEEVVGGTVKLDMELVNDDMQTVTADLTNAVISVPWAGWGKGKGVKAQVNFTTSRDGGDILVSDFKLAGEGFGASGALRAGKAGLISVDLEHVTLAPDDDFSMHLKHSNGAYDIKISGRNADIRGLINKIKSAGTSKSSGQSTVRVSAKLNQVTGFNDEVLRSVDAVYAIKAGKPIAVKLNAITRKEEAVVAQLSEDDGKPRVIELTSTDGGALARFTGVYKSIVGGLLNMRIRYEREGVWVGNADLRQFQIVDDGGLQALVSAPTGKNGKSLNDAVNSKINAKVQNFSHAFTRATIDNGLVTVSDGVVRGDQVGLTFEGTVRDRDSQMNLTGTFMPAYGLNRIFGELPLIGIFLGNGRDRGLIGVTFRLSGEFTKPKLNINPLSLIAPGVFRNIFKYQ